jgi:hypothetical protein
MAMVFFEALWTEYNRRPGSGMAEAHQLIKYR